MRTEDNRLQIIMRSVRLIYPPHWNFIEVGSVIAGRISEGGGTLLITGDYRDDLEEKSHDLALGKLCHFIGIDVSRISDRFIDEEVPGGGLFGGLEHQGLSECALGWYRVKGGKLLLATFKCYAVQWKSLTIQQEKQEAQLIASLMEHCEERMEL